MTSNEHGLLTLIYVAIGGDGNSFSPLDDWQSVMALAAKHGVLGIVVDGLEKLPRGQRPDTGALMKWLGLVIKQEQQFRYRWRVACQLADLWKSEGIETVVLKGRSLAQYYPQPEHRYSCDLDIFIPDGWEKACELLRCKGICLEAEVYKEVEFTVGGVYVECHKYITPIRGNKHLQKFEFYLRDLLSDEKHYFDGNHLIVPSLMFNVMLYVEHALGDFLHGKLLLKHLVDWMVLRRQHVDWHLFMQKCNEFGFSRFVSLINALVDVMEDKVELSSLPLSYQKAFNGIFYQHIGKARKSWFGKRVDLFFDIIRNRKRFSHFGYCSMSSFLWNAVYSHFFKKEVNIQKIGVCNILM